MKEFLIKVIMSMLMSIIEKMEPMFEDITEGNDVDELQNIVKGGKRF